MCLETVDAKTKKGTGIGYKSFRYNNQYHIRSEILFRSGYNRYKYKKWYTAIDDDSEDYPLGFHIFPTIEEAKMWSWGIPFHPIRKVSYEDVVASGTQNTFKRGKISKTLNVIVARRMYIYPKKETYE